MGFSISARSSRPSGGRSPVSSQQSARNRDIFDDLVVVLFFEMVWGILQVNTIHGKAKVISAVLSDRTLVLDGSG
jgi:hypothetical protein